MSLSKMQQKNMKKKKNENNKIQPLWSIQKSTGKSGAMISNG